MKTILHSRLPERLSGQVRPLFVELATGIITPLAFVITRVALVPALGERAPYAFIFLGVVIASVLAGWRSGLLAVAVGQVATWLLLVQPFQGTATDTEVFGGLLVSTCAQLLTLLVLSLYQAEIARGWSEREERMDLLSEALREIDHRARNNYQTVLSLVQLQAARADAPVKKALQQVADRITAVAVATEHLAIRSEDLATVRLRDHLGELCAQLERGLAQGEVRVECDVADVTASAERAIHLAIIVNELVTNALKHAFADGRDGVVRVRATAVDNGLEITVDDDGCGMKPRMPSKDGGLGRKLVETFVRHLDARHETSSSANGTVHKLLIPALA